jgi:N-dimethylarginine dimethylaminohydrolase
MNFGCHSEVGRIKCLLLKHPKDAFISDEHIENQWADLDYLGRPDFNQAVEEYQEFVALLEKQIRDILFLPPDDQMSLDSIYVHDPVVLTGEGAVVGSMGKEQRKAEPEAVKKFLEKTNVPILGAVTGEGLLEGGDVVPLDRQTLVVGQGYRTNKEGIRQLKALTRGFIKEFLVVPLPHWQGPEDVLHLMSIFSPVDHDLAVVYSRLMPVFFREWLTEKGFKLIEVSDPEFETMGCNVLAVAPRKCIMLAGNPRIRHELEEEGVEVWEYRGEDISRKGSGGPTCLTRPLWREK